jgi:hypothetical protein
MANIKINRKGNKIEVISFFTNQVFKGEYVDGRLKTKKPLDLKNDC